MFNKLQFNNLVISNKKQIQQGRIQTIHKLVQKIRTLKSKLQKKPEDEKNKERLRKTTENIEQLKKLKRVEIMKRILLMEKNPSAIITNGRATPEEVAIALLSLNKILQDLAKRFKTELKLSDADATWKDEILTMSKRRAKIARTEDKRQKRKVLKERKAFERKRLDWIKENRPEAEQDKPAETSSLEITLNKIKSDTDVAEDVKSVSSAGVWKVEPIICAAKAKKNAKRNERKQKSLVTNKFKMDTKEVSTKPTINQAVEDSHIAVKRFKSENMPIKQDSDGENDNRVVGQTLKLKTEEELVQPEKEEVTHVVDSFFITDNGENYLSTAVITRAQEQQANELAAKARFNTADNPANKTSRKMQMEHLTQPNKRYTNNARNDRQNNNRDNNLQTARQNHASPNRSSNTRAYTATTNDSSEKLHPSWAAKQKQKPVISQFQGKKISFNDNGDNLQPTQFNSIKPIARKIMPNSTSQNAEADLHPSWAAKQKLKPTITAFQGKKITFDNA